MPTAFLLIQTEPGYESNVVKQLRKIDEVEYVYATYGIYDIVAKVKVKTQEKLKELVTYRIRKDKFLGDKVTRTLTQIIVE